MNLLAVVLTLTFTGGSGYPVSDTFHLGRSSIIYERDWIHGVKVHPSYGVVVKNIGSMHHIVDIYNVRLDLNLPPQVQRLQNIQVCKSEHFASLYEDTNGESESQNIVQGMGDRLLFVCSTFQDLFTKSFDL